MIKKKRFRALARVVVLALAAATTDAQPAADASGAPANVRPEPARAPDRVDPGPVAVGERFFLPSAVLGERRKTLVYVPSGDGREHPRFPVIYTLDGESSFLHTVSASVFLASHGLMPAAIVVGVTSADRTRDFTPGLVKTSVPPPGVGAHGGADRFLAHLAEELVPAIERHYPAQPLRVLLGHSLGGLFALHAMIGRPGLFRGIATFEPALWWDERAMVGRVADFLRARPDFAGRLVMAEGTSVEGWRTEWEKVRPFAPANLRWTRIDVAKESHETMVYRGRFEALQAMFEDYVPAMRADDGRANLRALEEQYAALAGDYGYAVEIPEFALREVAERALRRKEFHAAVAALEAAGRLYPASGRTGDLLSEARRALAETPDAGTDGGRPAAPVGLAEGARFLGVWEGTLRTEPGMPAEISLVIGERDGALTAFMVARGFRRDGGDMRHGVPAIRVDGNAIEWERPERNGGTHVHRGTLTGPDTLEGRVELRDAPPGYTRPDITVTFRLSRTAR